MKDTDVAQMVKDLLAIQETRFDPWLGRSPEESTQIFLPVEFHVQRSLVGYNPWGHKVGHD